MSADTALRKHPSAFGPQPSEALHVSEEAGQVSILYTNYRGETAVRRIVPQRLWFGATSWHPEDGWLLDAIDVEKGEVRSFAMKDVRSWFTS
jgi:predicted DNA-binding transcriptional regulator YafY